MKKSNIKRKPKMKGSKTSIGQAAAIGALALQAMKGKKGSSAKTKRKGTKKRKVSKGSGESGEAWKVTKVVRSRKTLRKVDTKLKRKIDAINDYDKPFGEYRYISDQQLRQTVRDEYNIYYRDNNGILLDQFTPMQIWDAASILFNDKIGRANYYANVGQSWTNNVRYKQTIHVVSAYTKFEFKSTSSHVVNLEMYICTPRTNSVQQLVSEAVSNQANAQNDWVYYQQADGTIAGRGINFEKDFGVKGTDLMSLHKDYLVECVKFKFDPGEHKTHFVQGPKMFDIDGTKYAQGDGLTLNNYTKFAKFIFFKVINDQTVCGGVGPAATERVSRFPSNYQGGLSMRQMRSIIIRMPETTDIDPTAPATYAGVRQNTLKIGRFIKNDEGDVDQQVLVENPISLASILQ